jgi:hypothetical protein
VAAHTDWPMRRQVRDDARQKGAAGMWWLPAASLLVLSLVLHVTTALHVLSFGPLFATRQESARDSAIREAQARSSAAGTTSNARAASTIQLQAGDHPNVTNVDVPVPPDARLADPSSRGRAGGTPSPDRAVLATAGNVPDVLAFYRDELARRGWHEVRTWMSKPVDGVQGPGGAVSAFCRAVDMPALLVGVASDETGRSQVRLLIDDDQPGPCASTPEPDPREGHPPPVF